MIDEFIKEPNKQQKILFACVLKQNTKAFLMILIFGLASFVSLQYVSLFQINIMYYMIFV